MSVFLSLTNLTLIYGPKTSAILCDYVIPDDVINKNDVIIQKSIENWTKLVFLLDPPLRLHMPWSLITFLPTFRYK